MKKKRIVKKDTKKVSVFSILKHSKLLKFLSLLLILLALPVIVFLSQKKTNLLQHASTNPCQINVSMNPSGNVSIPASGEVYTFVGTITCTTPNTPFYIGFGNNVSWSSTIPGNPVTLIYTNGQMPIAYSFIVHQSDFTPYGNTLLGNVSTTTNNQQTFSTTCANCSTGSGGGGHNWNEWCGNTCVNIYHANATGGTNQCYPAVYGDKSFSSCPTSGGNGGSSSYKNYGPCAGQSTANSVCTDGPSCPNQYPYKVYGPGASKACTKTCCSNINPSNGGSNSSLNGHDFGPCAGQSSQTSVCTDLSTCPNPFNHKIYGPGASKACTKTCCSSI